MLSPNILSADSMGLPVIVLATCRVWWEDILCSMTCTINIFGIRDHVSGNRSVFGHQLVKPKLSHSWHDLESEHPTWAQYL